MRLKVAHYFSLGTHAPFAVIVSAGAALLRLMHHIPASLTHAVILSAGEVSHVFAILFLFSETVACILQATSYSTCHELLKRFITSGESMSTASYYELVNSKLL